jgi:elongation factor P--beta-lysine ligase
MFQQIIAKRNIEKEALDNFTLAKQQQENGVVLENHKLFIISFETKNRLRFLQKMRTKKKRKKAETTGKRQRQRPRQK